MSPTVMRQGPFRFFFNSREETRMHVHVDASGGTAKFWLEPIVALASFHNMGAGDLQKIESTIRECREDLIRAWHRHFGQ